jgi:pentatricopeptide repeat protein
MATSNMTYGYAATPRILNLGLTPAACLNKLQDLKNQRNFYEIVHLVKEMLRYKNNKSERSLLPNQDFYQQVNAILYEAKEFPLIFQIFQLAIKWNHPYNKITCGRLLQDLADQGHFVEMFSLLEKMEHSENAKKKFQIPLRAQDSTYLFQCLISKGKMEMAKDLLERLRRFGESDETSKKIIYLTIVNRSVKANDLESALYFWNEMKREGIPPDISLFSSILTPLMENNHLDQVISIFSEFLEAPLPKAKDQAHSYLSFELIRFFCENEKVDLAWEALKNSDDNRANSFNILISAFRRKMRPDDALSVFEEMKRRNIARENFTYNHLIGSLNDAQRPLESLEKLKEMRKEGLVPSSLLYSLTITALLKKECFNEVLSLQIPMNRDKIPVDDRILIGIYTALLKTGNSHLIMQRIQNKDSLVGANRLYYDFLLKGGFYVEAEEVFWRTIDLPDDEGKAWMCASKAHHLLQKGFDRDFQQLERMMNERGIPKIENFYQAVIQANQKRGYFNEGPLLIEQMEKEGIRPSAICLEIVLRGFFQAGYPDLAIAFFEKIHSNYTLEPRVINYFFARLVQLQMYDEIERQLEYVTFSTGPGTLPIYKTLFLNSIDKDDGSFNEKKSTLLKAFQNYWNEGSIRDTFIANCLIKIYLKEGCEEAANNIYAEMSSGLWCQPDQETHHVFMAHFSKKQSYENVFEYFRKLKNINLVPNEITFNILIRTAIRMGDFDQARSYYAELFDKGLTPTLTTITAMLEVAIQEKNVLEVERLYGEMVEKFRILDSYTYNRLISFFASRRDFPRSFHYLQNMREDAIRFPKIRPETKTYDQLVALLIIEKRFEEVLSLLQDMKGRKIAPGEHTKKALSQLKAHKMDGKIEEIYLKLIEAYALGGSPEEALHLLLDIDRNPDIQRMNVIIKGLSLLGLLDEAYEIFVKIKDLGPSLPLNLETYHALLTGYAKDEDVEESLISERFRKVGILLRSMKKRGIQKTTETDFLVTESYFKDRSIEAAKESFRLIESQLALRKKVRPDGALEIDVHGLPPGIGTLMLITSLEEGIYPAIEVLGETNTRLDHHSDEFTVESAQKFLSEYEWNIRTERRLDPSRLIVLEGKGA